ncbi:hypothetical protein DPMN_013284 [Dreissena polymorpha]|uniref:Uncharacterized protein n=1 Tax=Dreissena polymorpha TaxID=45954 RepID=A0A9D4N412_DREPO|nr:hypothetical protein DPMN_013284 [Dreissena polymorpha]
MTASVHTKKKNVCYAPTNDGEEDENGNFYNILSTIIQYRPKRNIISLIDDFNAKIDNINRRYE